VKQPRSHRNKMKPPSHSNAPPARYNTKLDPMKAEDSPAQTASVGDREMMTYMKLPISTMNGGPRSNDSDDARFLDGLFERLSASSDNGSDNDGKDGNGNGSGTATGASTPDSDKAHPNTTRGTSAAAVSKTTNSSKAQSQLTTFNLTGQLRPPARGSSSDVSSMTSSCHTFAPVAAAQMPQHLMYRGTDNTTAFLPENVLNTQQQAHQQMSGTAGVINPNIQDTMQQQFNSWMMNASTMTATRTAGLGPGGANAMVPQSALAPNQGQLSQRPIQPLQQHPALSRPQIFADKIQSVSAATSVMATGPPPQTKLSRKKKRAATPSDDNSSTCSSKRQHLSSNNVSNISEDEGDEEKRRRDRNMREQERSQRIACQISDLKALLSKSNVPFKPDKYSTLVSVHTYIKTLQQRSAVLDEEQKKLVDTIKKSNELVNKSKHGLKSVPSSAPEPHVQTSESGHVVIPSTRALNKNEDELMVFVRGLDYKSVFSKIRIALCVTSIDGRLLNCNDEFIKACGLKRETLVKSGLRKPVEGNEQEEGEAGKTPLSLFNLMAREDMQKVFGAMSEMLKTVHTPSTEKSNGDASTGGRGISQTHSACIKSDHWSSEISHFRSSLKKQLQLNISLVRQKDNTPRFFNCALTAIDK
jgi:PAS domain-containing protein